MTAGPDVRIREVGPRDGLQVEAPVPSRDRARLVDALVDAGLRHVEVAAFVSAKVVPAMAGAPDVLAALVRRAGVTYAVLVPNRRGAELAVEAGDVDELTFTVSASPAYNQRNVGMDVDQSIAEAGRVAALVAARGIPIDAVVSCAFGSPWEGDIDPQVAHGLGARLLEVGVTSLTYADTTGMATPRRVAALVEVTGPGIGLHLHDTRGTALVNAYAALECGITRFDSSVGGLGGSPSAPGDAHGGNLATEDLVHLLDDMGVATGVDLDRLLAASAMAAELVGHVVPSRVAAAGPRTRRASGT